MFEVYIHEAHAGQTNNSQYPEFAQFSQPKNMADRIEIFEFYRKFIVTKPLVSGDTIIIHALIDSISKVWEKKYSTLPTCGYVIGLDGEIKENTGFLTGSTHMRRLESAIEDELVNIDSEPPEVEVTSPTAGELLLGSMVHNVKWTATDNVGVVSRAIYLTFDGSSWDLVDSTGSNTGTFAWTVPGEVSNNCKIKVVAYDAMENAGNDESSTFIIGTTSILHNLPEAEKMIMLSKKAESFAVYIPFSGNYTVSVSDVQGRQLASFTTSNGRGWYTVPEVLSAGMHIISIDTPEKTIVKKFWFVR